MATGFIDRPAESRTIRGFLDSAAREPTGLVIEGEAGIGKTTLWFAAVAEAGRSGFTVLSARGGQAETALAYAAVADVLGDVDPALLTALPEVQRIAVDRVLLRANIDGPSTNQGVVAAAFCAVIERIALESAVLLAIDDVQWLDPSSRAVLAYAVRRFEGRVGILATERTERDGPGATSWLQLSRPDGMSRLHVGPLSLGGLHALITERFGRSLSRPAMVRIVDISGGNPFYALELARATEVRTSRSEQLLPTTLAELMRRRIGRLDRDAQDLLLAAACAAGPTVEFLAQATDISVARAAELLEEAKAKGLVGFDGDVVQFAHPLLARSVYTDARPSQRRAMHRSLAEMVTVPELRARHMALAASIADPATLEALDTAATSARLRGAPAAAAEFVELAIGLGGDTLERRIRAADHHMRAGDLQRAQTLLNDVLDDAPQGLSRSTALNLLAGMQIHRNSFPQAAKFLVEAFDHAESNREVQARTLLLLSFAQLNAGEFGEALNNADRAVSFAGVVGNPDLESQVISMREMVACMSGQGVSEANLDRARALESPHSDAPIALRASANHAVLMSYVGRLEEASEQMAEVRRHCVERGAETDMIFVSFFSTLIEIWRGKYAEAAAVADETIERAAQLGGDHLQVVAITVRALIAAHTGQPAQTREAALAAIDLAERSGSPRLADWSSMSLGFLEVSLGNHAQALEALRPLIDRFDSVPGTEIITTGYVPDAVEALVAVGRHAEAAPLIDAMQANGRRLDRAWMLAISARCRSLLLAAHGDIEAAAAMAQDALTEHNRLSMPLERARTLMLLGQLQRRQRKKEAAKATLTEALQMFSALGSPLWAARARAELERVNTTAGHDESLTPSERRVAELAASGMTTKDVAAALFISPKTVETNLSRIYRKLAIKSRAELGRVIR
ncbi:helix-turn-helix transcriptional regulator [Mycobacterium deserti]|uniref:LuxR C-terminal-related transcriptional regulator n=1 Tax=Mycobacterium deserti TaxID=2978347 RepID=A0ABT2MAT4_9MYCO|nr:LuxR C-terminal-related transcriptional regulator [Mycobacterium deserti]MCT7658275.1 LuxR C-terminal-related transcriptional regulator [Mycobacterium deserti]